MAVYGATYGTTEQVVDRHDPPTAFSTGIAVTRLCAIAVYADPLAPVAPVVPVALVLQVVLVPTIIRTGRTICWNSRQPFTFSTIKKTD
jgi:hypothetical protein